MSAYQFCLVFMFVLYIGLLLNMRRPSRRAPERDPLPALPPDARRDDRARPRAALARPVPSRDLRVAMPPIADVLPHHEKRRGRPTLTEEHRA